jgi:hypothetical protein
MSGEKSALNIQEQIARIERKLALTVWMAAVQLALTLIVLSTVIWRS